jgi:GTP-binding protein LepA
MNLKDAIEKLYLTDAALEFEPVYSQTLGAGFKVGFLGLLHADVVRERLEREFNQSLVLTPSRVNYLMENDHYLEPMAKVTIIVPASYMGAVMQVAQNARAILTGTNNVGLKDQVILTYEFPMSELMSNFYDSLKSATSGYASLDWEFMEYRAVDAGKLDIMLNDEVVEEFSEVVVSETAIRRARELVDKLKELIPRQQYEVKIQGRYKNKIVASSRVSPFRKDVIAKLYGGDRTRKDKLLKKQKKGKKLMKQIGKVEIPKTVFIKLFKI